jgi:hypothetical protein
MAEAILQMMAECTRPCGWIGGAHERVPRRDASIELFCPQCSGPTRSWVVDQAKAQADLDRLKEERLQSLRQSNQHAQQARLASERLHDAKRRTEFARHKVALLDKDHPQYLEAQHAMIAAQREEAEATLARDQAMTRVKAGER